MCGGTWEGGAERGQGSMAWVGAVGSLFDGGFLSICHPQKDSGPLKPLSTWDSSQWLVYTSHGTWCELVLRTFAP